MLDSGCKFTNVRIDKKTIEKEPTDNLNALAVKLNISLDELLYLIAK